LRDGKEGGGGQGVRKPGRCGGILRDGGKPN